MIRRCASKMRCQTMALAMPVSSSSVMKVTLPAPGRWRTRTMPAIRTLSPSFSAPSPAAGVIAAPVQRGTQEGERVGAQGELDGAVILDHLAALGHRRQRHFGLVRPRLGGGEQRQRRPPSPRTRHSAWRRSRPSEWKASASASFSSAAAGTPDRRQASSTLVKGRAIAAAAIFAP